MLLAIEAGNTNIKFSLVDGLEIKTRWRIATNARYTADQYAPWLFQLMEIEGISPKSVSRVVISTVVPRALHNLQTLAQKYFKVDAEVAGRGDLTWGIALKVDQPDQVGADRALNAISAHNLVAGDKIVISFGTATTLDHIGGDGAYCGGIIAPGVNLSLEALFSATAMLPRIAIEQPESDNVLGTTTETQMLIGIFWGYVAMVEGLIARMKAQIGRPVSVVATGGLAALFNRQSQLFDRVEPDLTLRGIALLCNNKNG